MIDKFLKITEKDIEYNLVNLTSLVFEVTDRCNLHCKYCGYGDFYYGYDPRGRGNLSLRKACNILNYLSKIWKDNIGSSLVLPLSLSFYGGEPLLNMKLIREIVKYTETLGIKSRRITYNMTTNGLLLHKYMDYLANKEFRLLISLDGNESDNSYRVDHKGNNSHKQITDNVSLLRRKYSSYFDKYVNFNTVLHNRNSVESARSYIKNNFGKETTISQLNPYGIQKEKVNEFLIMFQNVNRSIENADNPEKLEEELFYHAPRINQLYQFLMNFSGNIYMHYRSLFFDQNKFKTLPTATCIPFKKKMFITVNGKILQCERINHEFALGQIFEDKIEIDPAYVAKLANIYIFSYIKQCNSCAFVRNCRECVLANDDVIKSDTKCANYMDIESFQDHMDKNLSLLAEKPYLYEKLIKNITLRE